MSGIRTTAISSPTPTCLKNCVETSNSPPSTGRLSAVVVTADRVRHRRLPWFALRVQPQYRSECHSLDSTLNAPYHRNSFDEVIDDLPSGTDKAFFFFSYAGLRQVVGQFLSGAGHRRRAHRRLHRRLLYGLHARHRDPGRRNQQLSPLPWAPERIIPTEPSRCRRRQYDELQEAHPLPDSSDNQWGRGFFLPVLPPTMSIFGNTTRPWRTKITCP